MAKGSSNQAVEKLGHVDNLCDGALSQRGLCVLRAEGGQVPLFLIHEPSAEFLQGHKLTPHIDGDIPVFGLMNVQEAASPLRTIQAMAARLVQDLRHVQPVGPYRLAGWSFAGKLAYEIAVQLVGEDETVEFLGLIGTYYRSPATYLPASDMERMKEHIDRNEAASEWSATEDLHPIQITIHLFIPQDSAPGDPWRGWTDVVSEKQIQVVSVSGNHLTMMHDANVACLGEAISSAIHRAADDRQTRQSEAADSPVVTLQAGYRWSTPVFCIPGAGGNPASFAELAGAVDPSRPFSGLQPRGVEGIHTPHSSVQAAARAYLRGIQAACPNESVHLVGHSFGGWVALEMAQQLLAAGRTVASLTIIDSEAPDSVCKEYTRVEALVEMAGIFEQAAKRSLGIGLSDLAPLGPMQQLQLLHECLVRVGLMYPRTKPNALIGPVRTFETALRTSYRPAATYPEHVRLVLLNDDSLDDIANERRWAESVRGWRNWAPNLSSWRGPGNHMTALKQPQVAVLAEWLRDALDSGRQKRAFRSGARA